MLEGGQKSCPGGGNIAQGAGKIFARADQDNFSPLANFGSSPFFDDIQKEQKKGH